MTSEGPTHRDVIQLFEDRHDDLPAVGGAFSAVAVILWIG